LLNILYSAEYQAMELKPVEPVEHRGTWSYPIITLHETALDLLDELIPYEVVKPSSDIDAPAFGPGALLAGAAGSRASLEILSKTVGVDLTKPGLGYALVKLERVDGADNHASEVGGILVHARPRQPDPEYGLTPAFTSASTRLRHAGRSRLQDYGDQLTKDDANKVLDSFREFGTHYVSGVELGDTSFRCLPISRNSLRGSSRLMRTAAIRYRVMVRKILSSLRPTVPPVSSAMWKSMEMSSA
jgi:hypothetical protein